MSVPFYIEDSKGLVVDYRDNCPGDSYNDAWPFFYVDTKSYIGIAIHHAAGPYSQTIDDICWYHVNSRGWAGVGYHFLIKGGKAYYVGDLGTGRAHVAGLNDKYIGVCIVGDYTKIDPSEEDLHAAHMLCREFIEAEPERFPNINEWNQVKPHKSLGSTECPGEIYPDWWEQVLNGVQEESECEAKLKKAEAKWEEWKKKCRNERREHEKEVRDLNGTLERMRALCETVGAAHENEKVAHLETRGELEKTSGELSKALAQLGGAEETIERFQAKRFTLAESLGHLARSLKEVYKKWVAEQPLS